MIALVAVVVVCGMCTAFLDLMGAGAGAGAGAGVGAGVGAGAGVEGMGGSAGNGYCTQSGSGGGGSSGMFGGAYKSRCVQVQSATELQRHIEAEMCQVFDVYKYAAVTSLLCFRIFIFQKKLPAYYHIIYTVSNRLFGS